MNNKTLISKVAGVTFDGRQTIIDAMIGNEVIQLRPEPENAYDKNAIAVWVAFPPESVLKTAQIGYLPKEIAAEVAPHLEGENAIGRILEITGGFAKYDGSMASLGVILSVEIPGKPDDD